MSELNRGRGDDHPIAKRNQSSKNMKKEIQVSNEREPTEEMILAGIEAANRTMPYVSDAQCVAAIWKAMQAANIPDTHCIMSVKLTDKMIEDALPVLMREDDEDKYRALGQLICVWIEAEKEEQRNDN